MISHFALFAGGHLVGMKRFDALEALRLISTCNVAWVNFVPTLKHRIWALPEAVRSEFDIASLKTVD